MGHGRHGAGGVEGVFLGSVMVSVLLSNLARMLSTMQLSGSWKGLLEAAPPIADEGPLAARPQVAVAVDQHAYVLLFEPCTHIAPTNFALQRV